MAAAVVCAMALLVCGRADARIARPFVIKVVDADTGRGVPLVELRTVGQVRFFTDSAGVIAFDEPGLMGEEVFFSMKSHGYEEPKKDGFGIRGVRLKAEPGRTATVKIKRVNIAERMYRITGEGIYHHSALAGLPVPLENGVLNGKVVGQDTVAMAPYKGKLFWLWGDTNRPSYPLGNFKTSSATSLMPGRGGLDPSVGVDLTYYVDTSGFSKQMMPLREPGVVWMNGLVAVRDERGRERLMARWARLTGLSDLKERGFAVFNDKEEIFEKANTFDKDQHVVPDSQAYRDGRRGGDRSHVYFVAPYPTARIAANVEAFLRPEAYEGFSCLTPGTRFRGRSSSVERDAAGRLVWAWKRDTSPLRDKQWEELVKAKIVTHKKYTFYNVMHHPVFNQERGRYVYFEGTYCSTFSGNDDKTPRYDYNQMMYRLDLADERLRVVE